MSYNWCVERACVEQDRQTDRQRYLQITLSIQRHSVPLYFIGMHTSLSAVRKYDCAILRLYDVTTALHYICTALTVRHLGCVRLTLFRNRNTCYHDKKSLKRGSWSCQSTKSFLNYHVTVNVCRNVFPNLLKREI